MARTTQLPSTPRPHWIPEGAEHNIGGHVPHPPESCPFRFERFGIWWTDSALCISKCTKIPKPLRKGGTNSVAKPDCPSLTAYKQFERDIREKDALNSYRKGGNKE